VFTGSFQVLLWGMATELPDVWLLPQGRSTGKLVPFEPERWLTIDRAELRRVAMGGDVHLRFDQSPIRFGNYILETLQTAGGAREHCGSCSQPLRTYFRVGSQQVCAECTEKFKVKTRADRARYYRRALLEGVFAAIAGGAIHAVLVATTNISMGSILIGALIGIAIRRASHETAEAPHRLTAVVLTLAAGSLPLWRSQASYVSLVYLAVGVFFAWTLTGRNVRTEIHGPFAVS
jgi:hypothetical protein